MEEKKTRKKKNVDNSVDNVENAFMIIAKECVAGKYGSGDTRKSMIYNKVQSCINSLMR